MGWNIIRQIYRFHDVWVLTEAHDRESIEQGVAEEDMGNIHFSYFSLYSWLRPLLRIQGGHQLYYQIWQIRAYFAARKLHKKTNFDLFHHVTYANDWGASYIGALLPVPYVRGPGGGAHRTPKGLESEYSFRGRLWETARGIGQWVLRHDPFLVRGQNRARAILLCNRESLEHARERWESKIHAFPVAGISDKDLLVSTPSNILGEKFSVISAGSLIKVKGFGLAIKAFNQFAKRFPKSELTIVGSGPEELRLRKLVNDLGLGKQVHFFKWMPRQQLLSYMARHHAFLYPGIRDGGATVVVEAMAVGLPVICLDTGGPGMHVTYDSGIKIAPSSESATVDELSGALERLCENPELCSRMGVAARERAISEYHWDRLGEWLMTIYQEAVLVKDNAQVR